jgi:uncharacterized LabA/DUF88 family protein
MAQILMRLLGGSVISMMDWASQRMANTQRRAIGNVQLLQPWAMQPQLGLDVFGQPLPYIDLSKDDVVAQELNRLLAPVPAVAAALGWGAQQMAQQQAQAQAQGQSAPAQQIQPPSIPAFTPPPQLKDLPLPPAPQLPEPPKSLVETLTPYPQLPPFEAPRREWQDVAAQVIAGLVNPDILPFATQAFEKAYQERVAEARDRFERAAANALQAWQARRQAELADAQAQQQYQQQLAQLQNQYQQAVYGTQAQNIQAQNEQALREWQAQQQYGQWAYEQQWRAYDKEEQRRLAEEQKKLDREIRLELQKNQMAMNMYNSLMSYAQKPTLTAAERQTALAVIPALKSILPPEFHPYLDQVAVTIKAKPSVPELNLDIERKKAEAAIQQGWAKIKQGDQKLALARQRLAQRDYPGAMEALKYVGTRISQIRDDIRQIDTALGRTVDDIYSGRRVPAISGPERDRLYQQRAQLEQELQGLQTRYDEMTRSVLFGQPAPQQPKPQPQAQPKQPTKQPQQQPKPQGVTSGGVKWRVK